jgi:hypothetical protein
MTFQQAEFRVLAALVGCTAPSLPSAIQKFARASWGSLTRLRAYSTFAIFISKTRLCGLDNG